MVAVATKKAQNPVSKLSFFRSSEIEVCAMSGSSGGPQTQPPQGGQIAASSFHPWQAACPQV